MLMNIKLIDKTVLVKPILEQVTEAGIVLKTDFEPKTLRGKVVAVSDHPECSEVQIGDTVYFHKFAGRRIKLENEQHILINIIDIQAKDE